jgi:16S rRNA processing protein RimM
LDCYTTGNKKIGEIVEIVKTGSNDVYVVRSFFNRKKVEILIPAIKDIVKEINLEKKYLKIKNIKGLLPGAFNDEI